MRYKDIRDLIQADAEAKAYFDTLPKKLQDGLLAHGGGINNLEELKHFSVILKEEG